MEPGQKRKYRGRYCVNIGTSVSPEVFDELERLSQQLGVTQAEVVRRLIGRGLVEFHRDGRLPALQAISHDGTAPGVSSEVHAEG